MNVSEELCEKDLGGSLKSHNFIESQQLAIAAHRNPEVNAPIGGERRRCSRR